MNTYLTHPSGDIPAPRIFGRWMVTGPEFEDGSGWSMCLHENNQCQRCVATFDRQEDAEETARIRDKWDIAMVEAREAARNLVERMQQADAMGKMKVTVDETVPDGTIIIEKDGQEVARVEGIGPDLAEHAPPQVTHELSGVARPYKGLPKPQ